MNYFNKKAQTATEYMVVLAIVIIISLIVAAILGQFPGLGGSARIRSSSAFWHSADIGVMHFAISSDPGGDDIVITLRNNHNYLIRVTNITIRASDDFQKKSSINLNSPFVLAPGGQETIRASLGEVFCSRPGDPFSLSLLILYKDDVTGEQYRFTGGGNYLEGRCAG